MIAFATLFLSLVVGVQPVELLVGEQVSLVEVVLDGDRVAALSQEPWTLDCDFGAELVPHELVAIAYDKRRREIGRARQWVNLPRPPAEAKLVLERENETTYARLRWDSVVGAEPQSVTITFDGAPLEVSDVRRFELPKHDPEQLHFLRAELEFPRNVSSVAEVTFGGAYGDETRTELTAIPVQLVSGRKLPGVSELQGRFRKAGNILTVVATERGPASVFVVRDESVQKTILELGLSARATQARRRRTLPGGPTNLAHPVASLQEMLPLAKDLRLHFLWPFASRTAGATTEREVFDFSAPLTSEGGGLYWQLSTLDLPAHLDGLQRLADAVAVSGLLAARRNRRRAVVLVADPGTSDPSILAPAKIRRFLEALRVPLVVWSPRPTSAADAWGPGEEISSLRRLQKASRELGRQLERQRIVWVEGIHLPQDVTLAPGSGKGPSIRLVR